MPLAAAASLGLALLLGACSSSPSVRYYTLLDMARSGPSEKSIQTTGQQGPNFALQVLPVRLPAPIDQPQLLVRSSAGEVVPLDSERWLGPLADEIRVALVAQLTQDLQVPEVSAVSIPSSVPIYRLQIDVTRFESVRGNYVLQELNWSLRDSRANPSASSGVLLCRSRQVVPVSERSTSALVQAHQTALAKLGEQISQVAIQAPQAWSCP